MIKMMPMAPVMTEIRVIELEIWLVIPWVTGCQLTSRKLLRISSVMGLRSRLGSQLIIAPAIR